MTEFPSLSEPSLKIDTALKFTLELVSFYEMLNKEYRLFIAKDLRLSLRLAYKFAS